MAEETVEIDYYGEVYEVEGYFEVAEFENGYQISPEFFLVKNVFHNNKPPGYAWADIVKRDIEQNCQRRLLRAFKEKRDNDSVDLELTRREL